MTWNQYARLARQLDELYRDDERQAAGQAAARDAVAAAIGSLDARLRLQRQRLEQLSGLLQTPLPAPGPVGPAPVADPAQALQLAGQHADLADIAAADAERLAGQPRLLPGTSAPARNLLVYASCALAAVVAQFVLLALAGIGHLGTWTILGWVCAGFPLLAWAAGYFAIGALGRPVVGDTTVRRDARLGFAICFLAMPVAFCAFKVVTGLL